MAADTRTDREILESIYERLGKMIESLGISESDAHDVNIDGIRR